MRTRIFHWETLGMARGVVSLVVSVVLSHPLAAASVAGAGDGQDLVPLPPVEVAMANQGEAAKVSQQAPAARKLSPLRQTMSKMGMGKLVDLRLASDVQSARETTGFSVESSDYLLEQPANPSQETASLSSFHDGSTTSCDVGMSCDPGYGCDPGCDPGCGVGATCCPTDPCCLGGSCCDGSCCNGGACCHGACAACCRPPCFWLAGVEATFLGTDIDSGFVSYRLQDGFAAPPLDTTFGSLEEAAVDDFYIAPRLWLGAQCGCWGLVGRYWHMQAAEAVFDPFTFTPPGPTPDFGYFIHNRFEAYTVDVELTRSFCHCDTKNTLSFGARYASILNDIGLSMDGQVNNGAAGLGVISGNARSNTSAHGTGITGAWQGRRPFFCHSCLHLFYGVRGSVVWGPVTNSVETDTIEVTTGATAGSYNGAVTRVDDSLFILESQLGLQVDYRVFCFPGDAFFRVAGEYQYWAADGGSTVATSFAGFGNPAAPPFSQGQAFAESDGIDVNLIGLSIATGFTW